MKKEYTAHMKIMLINYTCIFQGILPLPWIFYHLTLIKMQIIYTRATKIFISVIYTQKCHSYMYMWSYSVKGRAVKINNFQIEVLHAWSIRFVKETSKIICSILQQIWEKIGSVHWWFSYLKFVMDWYVVLNSQYPDKY